MSGILTAAVYGKTLVRVLRVVREGNWHNVVEYNVEALLEGDFASRYSFPYPVHSLYLKSC